MKRLIFPALLVLSLPACAVAPADRGISGADVKTQVSPSAPFGTYRTWNWVSATDPLNADRTVAAAVRRSIEARMAERGYARSNTPDVAVAFTLGARESVELKDYGPYRPYYPAYGRRPHHAGWYPVYRDIEIDAVKEGSLAIDIYDAKTHEPVWHGHASRELHGAGADDTLIDTVVGELLASLPPAGR